MGESDTDRAECSRKVASGRRVAGANRSLVNAGDLQLECARALHETLFVPALMYGSEIMLCRVRKGLDEILMKASYGGSAMWRG